MAQSILPPDDIYGVLFTDVQLNRIFSDSKTFTDLVPRREPEKILADYKVCKNNHDARFNLKLFIEQNFYIPEIIRSDYITREKNIISHITNLWKVLTRKSNKGIHGSSLLPLPHEYIIPGGRFREIYYWDTYFTMLGLRESGLFKLMEQMVNNFTYLIDAYGHMPNGNRTYYLSRSQPPVFSLMLDLLAEVRGNGVYTQHVVPLRKEYDYWMDKSGPTSHLVKLPDGSSLNRYYDQLSVPRQESYLEDVTVANGFNAGIQALIYKDIRSAAESGWDFSSRWLKDGRNLNSIQTTSLVPVDLNCLLYHMELQLADIYRKKGNVKEAMDFESGAIQRKNSIKKYCWSATHQWFVDYNIRTNLQSHELTLAGMFPFFIQIAGKKEALSAMEVLQKKFLKPGGVVTSLVHTGQQWDAPNGWACLQWITVTALENYGNKDLAKDIALRWINLNKKIFYETGKLVEKYDVMDADKPGGGGEYPSQDGFGWTNGVLLALMKKYNVE